MAKTVNSVRKISFGKKRRGKAKKSYNKHDSRSRYHQNNARRNELG